jgi:hypothetical protein
LTVREEEALGPCVARYFASKLWAGEEYFVQIDSHIWFVEGWDSKLIQAMRAAPSKRPVRVPVVSGEMMRCTMSMR